MTAPDLGAAQPSSAERGPDARLVAHVRQLVTDAIGHAPEQQALVLCDRHAPFTLRLGEAYARALPHAARLDPDAQPHADTLACLDALPKGALVVLVQSTRFDLGEFRFRLELFARGLRVVEHPHVGRMEPADEDAFIDALAYDPSYFRGLGRALKSRIDAAARIDVHTPGGRLTYGGPFEDTKLNVGDYTGMPNIGGQFPIGEVFTEPKDLRACNGRVRIFAFGDQSFSIEVPEAPPTLIIEGGLVVGVVDGTPTLDAVLEEIRVAETVIRVRELGFGLNPALTRTRRVRDVGTYERMCGVHLSLGAKHAVYPKAGISRRQARFHVDVFADTTHVDIDGERVYEGDRYVI